MRQVGHTKCVSEETRLIARAPRVVFSKWPGISANGQWKVVFSKEGRFVPRLPNPGKMSKEAVPLNVASEMKASQVDKLAEFGGDRPCQRK